jgi:hypothetical protein
MKGRPAEKAFSAGLPSKARKVLQLEDYLHFIDFYLL